MTLQGPLPAKYSVRLLKINVDSFAQTWHELMRLLNKHSNDSDSYPKKHPSQLFSNTNHLFFVQDE